MAIATYNHLQKESQTHHPKMKNITDHECLGFSNLTISNVPETAEEFDTLAGKPGACLADAVDNVKYRGWNSEFRKAFGEAFKKTTSFDRAVEKQSPPNAKGETKPIYESEAKWLNRYVASELQSGNAKSKDEVMAKLQPIATEVAKTLKFDPKPSTRSTPSVGKDFILAATNMIAGLNGDTDKIARVVANTEKLNPGVTIELDENGIPVVESLAKAIYANSVRVLAEQTAALED